MGGADRGRAEQQVGRHHRPSTSYSGAHTSEKGEAGDAAEQARPDHDGSPGDQQEHAGARVVGEEDARLVERALPTGAPASFTSAADSARR